MNADTKAVLVRFLKGFVAGGIAGAATVPVIAHNNLHDFKDWIGAGSIAFLVGGILGLEKMFTQFYDSTQKKKSKAKKK